MIKNKKAFFGISLKTLWKIFVIVTIFWSALYLGVFWLIGDYMTVYNSDFIPYIPLEIRLGFYMVLLAVTIGVVMIFID